ncbi:unnamed protein product [Meganyctiphanes norvegica]|uniref:Carbonic anhydrase n=1 Tax=Meganyctiphanes norvegica TaxID=48144 RepID=A0AAV2PRQ6_MEGNR
MFASRQFLSLLLLLTIKTIGTWAAGGHQMWTYTGQSGPVHWSQAFQACGGTRQSPINIETGSVKVEYWQPFIFKNYDDPPMVMRVANNGHTAKVEMDSHNAPRVAQGGLKGDYIFAQLHFHWGGDSSQGSEHTIDGVRYPLEMHIVNYKASYGNLGTAVQKPDGLAVLGVMYEVSDTDNAALTPLVNALANITDAGLFAEVATPYPLRAFLPKDTEKFYRYEGSLTTPTCNEAVIWTVFDTPVRVSENQLNALRAMKTEDGYKLINNYRPTQPLHGREVQVSGASYSSADSISMKNMGLALYFISTMTVVMMNM